jgi:hypothetical protein
MGKNKFRQSFIKAQGGFGVAQVLIVSAITLTTGLIVQQGIFQGQNLERNLGESEAIKRLGNQLDLILRNPQVCVANFSGTFSAGLADYIIDDPARFSENATPVSLADKLPFYSPSSTAPNARSILPSVGERVPGTSFVLTGVNLGPRYLIQPAMFVMGTKQGTLLTSLLIDFKSPQGREMSLSLPFILQVRSFTPFTNSTVLWCQTYVADGGFPGKIQVGDRSSPGYTSPAGFSSGSYLDFPKSGTIEIEAVGGGGGGGNASSAYPGSFGSGGGGGGMIRRRIPVTRGTRLFFRAGLGGGPQSNGQSSCVSTEFDCAGQILVLAAAGRAGLSADYGPPSEMRGGKGGLVTLNRPYVFSNQYQVHQRNPGSHSGFDGRRGGLVTGPPSGGDSMIPGVGGGGAGSGNVVQPGGTGQYGRITVRYVNDE